MPVVIRSLSDEASLCSGRVPSRNDPVYAPHEVYYVVDLRPAESALAVETEGSSTFGSEIMAR